MSKKMKSTPLLKLLAIICITPSVSNAQDMWKLSSSLTTMTGNYVGSQSMDNQHGLGIRISGEKDQTWGLTAGLQSTRIDMNSSIPKPTQNQDNWFLSGFVHMPSMKSAGRWTFQLDAHQISNDASQSISSDVHVVAPQVTWLSYTQPLKIDFSYANSSYKDTKTIHQLSSAMAYGFNDAKDWLQVRSYAIKNLNSSTAVGQLSTRATDVKLTHFVSSEVKWAPTSVTLGIERGKRIYVVDMTTQTVYNLPMLNEGGENISASWKISPKSNFNMQFSKTRYLADQMSTHRFTLSTLSAEIATSW